MKIDLENYKEPSVENLLGALDVMEKSTMGTTLQQFGLIARHAARVIREHESRSKEK